MNPPFGENRRGDFFLQTVLREWPPGRVEGWQQRLGLCEVWRGGGALRNPRSKLSTPRRHADRSRGRIE